MRMHLLFVFAGSLLVSYLRVVYGIRDSSTHDHSRALVNKNVDPAEYEALYDFYISLNGENWVYLNTSFYGIAWDFTNSSSNPCLDNWQGVSCDYGTPGEYYHVNGLSLSEMNLVGTLPDTISTFTELYTLNLMLNRISGSVPNSIGDLINLSYLFLSDNLLSGGIPDSFGNLTKLFNLMVAYNLMSGPVPDSLQNIHTITSFDIGLNYFSHTIPAWLGNYSSLTGLDFYFNELTGSLPIDLCNLQAVQFFELQFNHLTGEVPACFNQLHQLRFLGLYNNELTGALPELGTYFKDTIMYIELQNNHFSRTIPSSFGQLPNLQLLSLHNNTLSGTIPATLHALKKLQFLSLRINKLTGTIPMEFVQLTALTELLLEHNHLSGNLYNRFNHTTQRALQTIQVNDNRLTGTIPDIIFLLPKLLTFAAVSNCFEGPFPSTVCEGVNLRSLVMDGLTSAESCHNNLFPHVSSTYSLRRSFGGTVPECVYSLPNLTTLHLSGNEFTGTLPNTAFSSSLVDLSLSHNRITGTIPLHIQTARWYCLDLSYNQISGTLDSRWSASTIFDKNVFFSKYVTEYTIARIALLESHNITLPGFNSSEHTLYVELYLENNRLSGRIPKNLQDREEISILGSNVFACKVDHSNLPQNDAGVNHYQCGSDNFNVPYYLWLGLLCVGVGVTVVLLYGHQLPYFRKHFSSETLNALNRLYHIHLYAHFKSQVLNPLVQYSRIIAVYDYILSLSVYSVVIAVTALMPLYFILTLHYGTLSHEYAWAASAAFLSGVTPMVLIFIFLMILVICVVYVYLHLMNKSDSLMSQSNQVHSVTGNSITSILSREKFLLYLQNTAVYGFFISVNLFVVVGVNVAYVYVVIYRGSELIILSQILISLFKLIWNNVCSSLVLQQAAKYLVSDNTDQSGSQAVETRFTSLLIFIALFNNIVIPCLVVAVVSPSCFYNVFVAAPLVTSNYAYETCALLDRGSGACVVVVPVLSETSYRPPFTYAYQCSSSLVTYYAPAFLNLCIVSAFVTPLMQYGLYKLHSQCDPASKMYTVLDRLMTRLLKPLRNTDSSAILSNYNPQRPFFKAGRILIILYTYLALLLTFGAVFPPLAFALFVTLCIVLCVVRLRVGRFIKSALTYDMREVVSIVESECMNVGTGPVLYEALWMLITVSCWFYTLFLFDTLGDAVGLQKAYWVLIVMPLMPVMLFIVSTVYCKYVVEPKPNPSLSAVSSDISISSTDVINRLHTNEQEREVELSVDRSSII